MSISGAVWTWTGHRNKPGKYRQPRDLAPLLLSGDLPTVPSDRGKPHPIGLPYPEDVPSASQPIDLHGRGASKALPVIQTALEGTADSSGEEETHRSSILLPRSRLYTWSLEWSRWRCECLNAPAPARHFGGVLRLIGLPYLKGVGALGK